MKFELRKLVPEQFTVDPIVLPENPNSAWLGANMICEMSSFESKWISKKDYFDNPNIMFKNCY